MKARYPAIAAAAKTAKSIRLNISASIFTDIKLFKFDNGVYCFFYKWDRVYKVYKLNVVPSRKDERITFPDDTSIYFTKRWCGKKSARVFLNSAKSLLKECKGRRLLDTRRRSDSPVMIK